MTTGKKKALMEERILNTTDKLFYGQGIRAVGVDTIAAEVGISKRTLYNYFPSKDALIVAYLTRRLGSIGPSIAPPVEQLLDRFNRLEDLLQADDFRGCPFVNAVAELGMNNHPANAIALEFKERRRVWYRGLLEQLGVAEPDALATQLMLLSEGAIAAALVRGDPTMARFARDAVVSLLRSAGVEIPPDVVATRLKPQHAPPKTKAEDKRPTSL